MVDSLRFVVDHLLRPGARAQGRPQFAAFTFDHVLDGAVMGRVGGDRASCLVSVIDNEVTGRTVPAPCEAVPTSPAGAAERRPRPTNVIEFRPRRA